MPGVVPRGDGEHEQSARRTRRPAGPAQGAPVDQQVAVEVLGVDVGDDERRPHGAAVGEHDAGHRSRRSLRCARPRTRCGPRTPSAARGPLQRGPHGVEPAHRVPAAEALLDVGDACERRRGTVRRRARVRRVAARPLHEPRVVERATPPGRAACAGRRSRSGRAASASAAAAARGPSIGPARNVRSLTSQMRRPRASKRRHADAGAGPERLERRRRGVGPVGDDERRAVGPAVVELRVEADERRPRRRATSRRAPARRRQVGQRQRATGRRRTWPRRGGAVASFPPSTGVALEDLDVVAGRGEADGDGETADAGADDHDVGRVSHGHRHDRPRRQRQHRRAADGGDQRGRRRRRRSRPSPSRPSRRTRRRATGSGAAAGSTSLEQRPSRPRPVTNQPAKLTSGMPR